MQIRSWSGMLLKNLFSVHFFELVHMRTTWMINTLNLLQRLPYVTHNLLQI